MFDDVSAAVLAGGLGTRLRPVVADRPKVLAPVAGRPFLAHLLDQLARAGVRESALLVGYGADQVQAAFGERHAGMRLTYSIEPGPLGTAGALRLALPRLRGETVLLLNGDSYCELDLRAFLGFHRERAGGVGMALARVKDASRFGRVQVGPDDRVIRFEEKNPTPTPGWINAGVYLLHRDRIVDIPADRSVSLERELLPAWVACGDVRGFRGGRFIDIGVPESYDAATAFFRPATCRRS
ncbi:MAG TPA: nucleotidyltransferase family protein [Gemmataceae bacterium]|nr:nucleotidyltransferase family protein [Gemmataceae bacterium]